MIVQLPTIAQGALQFIQSAWEAAGNLGVLPAWVIVLGAALLVLLVALAIKRIAI